VECCQMAARPGGKIADQGHGPLGTGGDAGTADMSGYALLLPIGHTEGGTRAYSCRHGSFTPLGLAAKSAEASIGSQETRARSAPVGGDVDLKTVLGWAAVAFIVWWILVEPAAAAHVVHNIGAFLSSAAHGISTFITSI